MHGPHDCVHGLAGHAGHQPPHLRLWQFKHAGFTCGRRESILLSMYLERANGIWGMIRVRGRDLDVQRKQRYAMFGPWVS